MAFSERSLDDYVDVAQRIADFRKKYPDGSLQPADPYKPWEQAVVTGVAKDGKPFTATMIVYVAAAYRTPGDERPGIGVAWEVFPGRTPYTLGSELMNAETSAWGRAIVAVLASDSKKGVASRQEVEARRAERESICMVCFHAHDMHNADQSPYCSGPNCGCGRYVPMPTNADGSLSRSRTSDAQKDAAGVMTAAQQAGHTALQPKRGKPAERLAAVPADDPWYDAPAPMEGIELEPGSVSAQQQRAIHAACTGMDRAERLATIGDIVGRQVASSNELSYTEAARVLGKLSGATA